MGRTRVLIAGLPPVASRILRNLVSADPRLELVAREGVLAELTEDVARSRADVVITRARDAGDVEWCTALLRAHPRLRVVVLSADGRTAVVHRVVAHRTVLADVSSQALLDTLHQGDVVLH